MKPIKSLTILFIIIFCSALFAQKENLSNEPGYVDFGDLGSFEKGNDVTEVNLNSKILKMVSKLSDNKDPDLAKMLHGLKLIKVNVFHTDEKDIPQVKDKIISLDRKLGSDGWDRIVRSRDHGELVNVYIKSNDKNIDGLVVTNLDHSGEAAFVNIVGPIDMELIGRLGEKFDIPSLNDLKKK
jgi:Domain of unknown function (DUF4252)